MTTPNEDLILKLRGQAYTTCRPDQLCDQAADLLQSQAERIKALELDLDVQAGSIRALRAALANAEPLTNVRTVTVSKFGVSFGNTTVSHERITGRNAEALNEGSGGVVSNEYMKWLNPPKDTL